MLFKWTGTGLAMFLVYGVMHFVCSMVVDSLFGEEYYKENAWPQALADTLSAVVVFVLDFLIEREQRNKGREQSNTFLFIPTRYWPAIFICMAACRFVKPGS